MRKIDIGKKQYRDHTRSEPSTTSINSACAPTSDPDSAFTSLSRSCCTVAGSGSNSSGSWSWKECMGPPRDWRISGSSGDPAALGSASPKSSVENDEAEDPPRSRRALVS